MSYEEELQELEARLPRFNNKPEMQKPDESDTGGHSWKCYCCGDKGIVHPHLAKMIIPDYDAGNNRLPLPLCQRTYECRPTWVNLADIDERFDRTICEDLHKIALLQWKRHGEECAKNIEKRHLEVIQNFTQTQFAS